MQLEKSKDQSVGLALFLRDSFRITDRRMLEELLVRPNARELVRSASYQDIFFLIKTVGLADSLELLPLTSREQRCGFIDLDCWRKDSFHLPSFMEWMAAFIQCGPEEAVRMARAVDANVLALFLKDSIQVHLLDPEEPCPDLPLFLTPDDRFGIEMIGEAERASMARLLLDALFRFDPSLGHDLVDRVYWENRVVLEEEAYQDKRRRLEEIGFVDYYDALEIYGEADTKIPLRDGPSTQNELTGSSTLAAMFVASLTPGHYLRVALQTIQSSTQAEGISQGLAALANRLLSVYSVTPGDLEKVKPALEEMRDILNLSLEHLTQGQEKLAGEALERYKIQGLFKIGFSLISQLRDQADSIFRRGNLRLDGGEDTLLECPEAEFYLGVRRLRPLFFRGFEDPGRSTYRHFQSLADLDRAKKLLDQIDVLSTAFWRMMGTPCREFRVDRTAELNLRLKELRFSQIFNSALVNDLKRGAFEPSALSAEDLATFLKDHERFGLSGLREQLVSAAERRVRDSASDSPQHAVVAQFARKWAKACAEELFPLSASRQIDPRFVRSLIARLVP